MSLSIITVHGNLGRDAELKTVGENTVCEFSVAVSKKARGEETTSWYRAAVWGKRGESLAQHLTKGTSVVISGEFIPREYKNKEDELRTSLDIRVDQLSFAGGGKEREQAPASNDGGGW